MIRINLLPVRQLKQRAQAIRQLVAGAIILAVTVAVLLAGTLFLITKVSGLEGDIKELSARKKELQKQLDLIVKLEKKKKLIEKQISIVDNLKKKSQVTVRILDEIARITPHERMWLIGLSQNAGSLKLNGAALDNRTIADYLAALKKSPFFKNVTLGSSKLYKFGGRNLKKFSLSASIASPETDDETPKEKGKK